MSTLQDAAVRAVLNPEISEKFNETQKEFEIAVVDGKSSETPIAMSGKELNDKCAGNAFLSDGCSLQIVLRDDEKIRNLSV